MSTPTIIADAAFQIAADLRSQCTTDEQADAIVREYEPSTPDLAWLAGLLGCKPAQIPGEMLREFTALVRAL